MPPGDAPAELPGPAGQPLRLAAPAAADPRAEYDQIPGIWRPGTGAWSRRGTSATTTPSRTEYRLRRRTGRYLDPDQWRQEEARLSGVLRAGVEGLGLPEPRRRRYVASATEQEIAAGALAGDPDEAVCFVREIDGYPRVAVTGETHFVDGTKGPRGAQGCGPPSPGRRTNREGIGTWGADGPVFSRNTCEVRR